MSAPCDIHGGLAARAAILLTVDGTVIDSDEFCVQCLVGLRVDLTNLVGTSAVDRAIAACGGPVEVRAVPAPEPAPVRVHPEWLKRPCPYCRVPAGRLCIARSGRRRSHEQRNPHDSRRADRML